MLDDADAKRYGAALQNALRHFPMKTTQKVIDCTALAIVAFEMEAPRVMVSAELAKQRKGPQPARGPAQIFRFNTPAGTQATPPSPAPPAGDVGSGSPAAEVIPDLGGGEQLGPM